MKCVSENIMQVGAAAFQYGRWWTFFYYRELWTCCGYYQANIDNIG